MTLKVKVMQIWDNTSDKITQTGLIGDETGIIKFTIWESANLPPMEEGRSCEIGFCMFFGFSLNRTRMPRIRRIFTDNCIRGHPCHPCNLCSISLLFSCPMQYIVQIKEDINVRQQEEESTGAVVDIQSGSGLIKLINHRVGYELRFINEHEKINIGCNVLLIYLV